MGQNSATNALGVKRQIAMVVIPDTGRVFTVLESGDARLYVFSPMDPTGRYTIGPGFPVAKKRLSADMKRMLAAGCGNFIPARDRGRELFDPYEWARTRHDALPVEAI